MNKKCKTIKEQNRKPCNAPQTTDACSHLIIYIPFISCHTRCHTFLLFIVTVYTWHCQKKEADDFSESITASIVHDWVCFPSFVSTLFGCGHSILATWFKLYATSDPSAWSRSTRIIYTRTVESWRRCVSTDFSIININEYIWMKYLGGFQLCTNRYLWYTSTESANHISVWANTVEFQPIVWSVIVKNSVSILSFTDKKKNTKQT